MLETLALATAAVPFGDLAVFGEALGAFDVVLTREEVARIEQAVPAAQVAGTRYGPAQMAMLDSERPAPA